MKKLKKNSESVKACVNCKHALFCLSWGDYKCTKRSFRIRDAETTSCDLFELSKTNMEDRKCHCEACSERGDMYE